MGRPGISTTSIYVRPTNVGLRSQQKTSISHITEREFIERELLRVYIIPTVTQAGGHALQDQKNKSKGKIFWAQIHSKVQLVLLILSKR